MRKYQLLFYPIDNSIEMVICPLVYNPILHKILIKTKLKYDIKSHRSFLKRSKNDDLKLKDLYVGNMITILSRSMKITEYGDSFTQRSLEKNQEK